MRVVDLSSLLTAVCTRERTEALIVAVVVAVVDFAAATDADDDVGVRDFSLVGYGLNLADLSLSAMMEGRMPELASRLV